MILMDRIELNPRVCNGRPVIKGTRIAFQGRDTDRNNNIKKEEKKEFTKVNL